MAVVLMLWMIKLVLDAEHRLSTESTQLRQAQFQLGNDRLFIVESCVRLNILRAGDNISHYADYKVFKVVYDESRQREIAQHLAGNQKLLEDRFLAPLKESLHEKTWTPLTHCDKAVNKAGVEYRPPLPIHFLDAQDHEHIPTPAAFVLPAGEVSQHG